MKLGFMVELTDGITPDHAKQLMEHVSQLAGVEACHEALGFAEVDLDKLISPEIQTKVNAAHNGGKYDA